MFRSTAMVSPVMTLLLLSMLYFCYCGVSCAAPAEDAAVVETAGCCSSEAPATPSRSNDAGDCACVVKESGEHSTLLENIADAKAPAAFEPLELPRAVARETARPSALIDRVASPRGPPVYLRFEILLI